METKARAAARAGALGLVVGALLVAALLGAARPAGAQTISEPSDGWTRENFASSCKAAGGRLVEIDSPGIKYSKCYFPGGGVNKCDWVKKVCTYSFTVQDGGTHAPVGGGVATDAVATEEGSGGSTLQAGIYVVPSGGTILAAADDDDRP